VTVTRIPVGGDQPYDVVVGTGVLSELPALVGGKARSVVVISTASVAAIARPAMNVLSEAGYQVLAEKVPDGEAAKTVEVAARLWSSLAAAKFTRTDVVVGIGGGAATDLAGFVAATWLRGVRVVLLPTTLLAMVDAAVGGKTAIDLPEGKNLVGAFYPPAGVLADLATLETVPAQDYASGLAEVVKAGFIHDVSILKLVEADPAGAAVPHGTHSRELIERAIKMKAAVVSADLRESGLRETLNYGHTLGHAIERAENYQFRHGFAVSIGMVFAAELARLAGHLSADDVDRHRNILTSVGLPVSYRPGAWPELRATMSVDKKSRGARLRFVVLDGIGHPVILDNPAEDMLEQAYQGVSG
jgi:3-dehydroquinate synthase